MGLDQYAHEVNSDGERPAIACWRKHNRLQGWMEALYREKGGTGDFNCQEVALDLEDLHNLEDAVRNRELPETHGFFFGQDSYEDPLNAAEDRKADLAFIKKAREALRGGSRVVYSSWY